MDSYPNAAPEAEYSRDLALLEHLKETIRAGQHPYYRPIPRPDKLMNMYLGPHRAAGSFVLPHPEQLPGHDSAVQSHALGSSSRPVVVDSDSSRQSSVERSAGPTRSAVEVDQDSQVHRQVPFTTTGTSTRPLVLPSSSAVSASDLVSNTHSPTETSYRATASAIPKELPPLAPSQSRSDVSAIPAQPAPSMSSTAAASTSTTATLDEQNRPRELMTTSTRFDQAKPTPLSPASGDKSGAGDSRKGVWEHRVIYERDNQVADDRRRRLDGQHRSSVDDPRPRPDDRYHSRDDRMDVDHRDRRPPMPGRDDHHLEPRVPAPRAASVASSDRSDARKSAVLISDDRKLPQDRLFPPDDPRAPIDNTVRCKTSEKSSPPPEHGRPAVSVSASNERTDPKAAVAQASRSSVSATFPSTMTVVNSEPVARPPLASAPVPARPNTVVSAVPASIIPSSAGVPPKPDPNPPSIASSVVQNGENRSRALSEILPLPDRPPRVSGSSTIPSTPMKKNPATSPTKDPKEKPPAKSMSLLDRLSDAPGAPEARSAAGLRDGRRHPITPHSVGFKPKAEPTEDRIPHAGEAKPSVSLPARPAAPMGNIRERIVSTTTRPHDLPRRNPSPPRPASYSRPPRPPPAVYERPVERLPDHRSSPVYPEDYGRRGAYHESEWAGYDRRREYDDRVRPTLEERLGMAPPALAPGYHDDGRYRDMGDSRVRRRSPSPGVWGAPPPKRARDDGYTDPAGYYDEHVEALRRLHYENERLREAYVRDHYGHDGHHGRPEYYDDQRGW